MQSNTPISETRPKKDVPSGCLISFGSLFFLIGLFVFWNTFIVPLRLYLTAQSWQQVPCTILTAQLKESRGDDSTTYRAEFTYEYQFAGARYVGNRDNPFKFSSSRESANARLDALPVGMQTQCWVNPQRPKQSLLDRSITWGPALTAFLIFICFCGIGGGLAYYGLRMRRKQLAERAIDGSSLSGPPSTFFAESNAPTLPSAIRTGSDLSIRSVGASLATGQHSLDAHTVAEDLLDQRAAIPQRLKPKQTRIARLFVILFLVAFWCGIVGIFVYTAIFDPPFDDFWGRIGLSLFLIPFVLVGLALIGGFLHTLLSMFNPSVSVALSTGAPRLGGELDVAWEVSGGLRSLQRLNVVIIGQEWCRYVQGTDTRTDISTFAVIEICTTNEQREISFGSRNITFPIDTMHSFEATNNKIQWTVRVQGEIAWWPNVSEDFAFRVTPPIPARSTNDLIENGHAPN